MSETEISLANELYPERKFEIEKAVPEVVHRYFAGSLGLLIIGLFLYAVFSKPRNSFIVKITSTMTALVLFQSLLGYFTVSLKLWPQVVTAHLLGGFATTTLLFLTYLKLKEINLGNINYFSVSKSTLRILNIAFPILIVQIILGVWLSSNYAALACSDFPLCKGQILPDADYVKGLNFAQRIGPDYLGGQLDHQSRVAIHLVHRFGALVVTLYFLFLAYLFAKEKNYFVSGLIGGLLFLQLALGISNIIYRLPLYVAIAHNLGALFLLLGLSYARLRSREY
jgi:cytochrome c oxidase assembly protein subunit 15